MGPPARLWPLSGPGRRAFLSRSALGADGERVRLVAAANPRGMQQVAGRAGHPWRGVPARPASSPSFRGTHDLLARCHALTLHRRVVAVGTALAGGVRGLRPDTGDPLGVLGKRSARILRPGCAGSPAGAWSPPHPACGAGSASPPGRPPARAPARPRCVRQRAARPPGQGHVRRRRVRRARPAPPSAVWPAVFEFVQFRTARGDPFQEFGIQQASDRHGTESANRLRPLPTRSPH